MLPFHMNQSIYCHLHRLEVDLDRRFLKEGAISHFCFSISCYMLKRIFYCPLILLQNVIYIREQDRN